MSGKPKGGPLTPEQEREQLRQLTRELHEAAQHARDAARELDAAVAAAGPDIERRAEGACQDVLTRIVGISDKCVETLQRFEAVVDKRTDEAVKAIEENHAHLTGFATAQDLGQYIGNQSAQSLAGNQSFIDVVVGLVFEMVMGGLSADELPLARKNRARRGGTRINVATRDELDAYIAAGGDPGLVIDLTKGH